MSAIPQVALSLRQPWAHFVVYGGKAIENRRWNTKFRGEFLIHAAIGMTRKEYDEAISFAARANLKAYGIAPRFDECVRGGIIGRGRVVDVIPPCADPSLCTYRWHMHEQYGFVLADVAPLPFVPYKGSLGFFRVSDELVARIREAA